MYKLIKLKYFYLESSSGFQMDCGAIHLDSTSRENVIGSVYAFIKNYQGKPTRKYLEEELSQFGKQPVRYAILRLTKEGRIKRVRGFGSRGIEYYYKSL